MTDRCHAPSGRVQNAIVDDDVQGIVERSAAVEREPSTGVTMPRDIETIRADIFETAERRVEFPAQIIRLARAIALHEPVVQTMKDSANVDRIIVLRDADRGQKSSLQDRIDESLAGGADRGLFLPRNLPVGRTAFDMVRAIPPSSFRAARG